MKHSTHLLLVALLALSPVAAHAQDVSGSVSSGEDAFVHRYARPGRATMTVYIWGEVGIAGIWRVEREIDLVELLSAAQVPGIGGNELQYRRKIVLNIYRGQAGSRTEVYSEPLERIVAEGGAYPTLRPGDVLELEIERNQRFTFQTVTQYVGAASSLLLLILRIARL